MNDKQSDTSHLELPVAGMTCGGCATNVGRALRAIPGVRSVTVDRPNARALVEVARRTAPAALVEAVRRAGYQPGEPRETGPVTV